MSITPHTWTSTRYHDDRAHRRRIVRRTVALAVVLAVIAVAFRIVTALNSSSSDAALGRRLQVRWPSAGQAAVATSVTGNLGTSGTDQPVPIASLAKVMTAYVVLAEHPLAGDDPGFLLTVTDADVRDTARRAAQDESIVALRSGQVWTERDALLALLLPSANNLAAMLATATAGSEAAFVDRMNARARALGLRHTTYTDPSGFNPSTRSTAADQLRLAQAAMRMPVLAAMVARRSAAVPTGSIHTTDSVLGRNGFVGIKTGFHDAAGGCFMFRSNVRAHGKEVTITGVVLGQPTLGAALQSGTSIVTGLAPQLAGPS